MKIALSDEKNIPCKIKRLYIHVPFCASKCGYCAFYSVAEPESRLIDSFFERLEESIKENAGLAGCLDSIYIGGGTPGWLPVNKLERLFNLIYANFAVSEYAEINIECNPESLDHDKVSVIANFANRISLGIQSFSMKYRNILGRKGQTDSIYRASEFISDAGIDNLGCDLIYSIPGQSIDEWIGELDKAVGLGVKHISAYSLTYEEGTVLFSGHGNGQDEDLEAEFWIETGKFLSGKAFGRYEISNYCRPGFECRHNNGIWFGDRYLGLGPSASSFDGEKRWTETADIGMWLNRTKPSYDEISHEARAAEILVMGLRTSQGWMAEQFHAATSYNWETWSGAIEELEALGLMSGDGGRLFCTEKGLLLWNEVAEKFISA